MPSSRAILADITDLKLDPKKAHSAAGKNGRLKQDVVKQGKKQPKVQEQQAVQPTVEVVVPEVVKPVVEPVSEKQETVVDVDDKLQKPVKTGKKKKDEEGEAVS